MRQRILRKQGACGVSAAGERLAGQVGSLFILTAGSKAPQSRTSGSRHKCSGSDIRAHVATLQAEKERLCPFAL